MDVDGIQRHGSQLSTFTGMTSAGNLVGQRSAVFSMVALFGFIVFLGVRRWWRRRMLGTRLLARLLPGGMPGVKRRASGKSADDDGAGGEVR